MSEASPRLPTHRKTSRHCLLTRIECHPSRLPRSFSKWLLGGTRRSWSVTASSIIWSLRKRRASKSDGMFREAMSSTKKAYSHSSRKLRIIHQLHKFYVPPKGTKINGHGADLKPDPDLPLAAEAPFDAAVVAANASDVLVETLLQHRL